MGPFSWPAAIFERGWTEYDWRLKTRLTPGANLTATMEWELTPRTDDTPACRARIRDTLQFIRYAPLVKELGGTVIVECQQVLSPILRSCPGIDRLIARGDELPAFDVHAPLLSLPVS